METGLDGDLDLGADAVGRRHQDRVLEAGGLEVEQPAEAADFRIRAGPSRGAYHRLDEIDQTVARIDIDTRIRVSEPVFAVDHAQFQYDDGWLRGIPRSCNGSQAPGVHTMWMKARLSRCDKS